ncbi:helix-turn-helix domain-containing protein [Nocardia gipuzkoensis]
MDDLLYQVLQLSTLDVPEKERSEYWAEHVRANHGELGYDFGGQRDFIGATRVQRCGSYQLIEFQSSHIIYRRTSRHVRKDDDRSARLIVPLDRHVILTRSDHGVELSPGGAGLVSMGRPFDMIQATGARAWVLTLPESSLTATLVDCEPLALDRRRGTIAAALAMTDTLAAEPERLSGPDFVAISSRLIELLTLSLDERSTPTQTQLALLARAAQVYIAERSDDPSVTPTSIAAYLGCSLRQLQLALQTIGTSPAQLLRDHRLDRARRRLQDPFDNSGISEIAFRSGFSSLSAFGEAFRHRFGTSPKKMRGGPSTRAGIIIAEEAHHPS